MTRGEWFMEAVLAALDLGLDEMELRGWAQGGGGSPGVSFVWGHALAGTGRQSRSQIGGTRPVRSR
jgi:hypothetical protein